MTTLHDLPNDRYVLAALGDGALAAVPHGDPLAPLARRRLAGKREPGDEAAIRAWLMAHPQFRITPVTDEPIGQLALWEAA